jgi:hypothetical protein
MIDFNNDKEAAQALQTKFLNLKNEISKAIERFEKYTTLMYRPPEMID